MVTLGIISPQNMETETICKEAAYLAHFQSAWPGKNVTGAQRTEAYHAEDLSNKNRQRHVACVFGSATLLFPKKFELRPMAILCDRPKALSKQGVPKRASTASKFVPATTPIKTLN